MSVNSPPMTCSIFYTNWVSDVEFFTPVRQLLSTRHGLTVRLLFCRTIFSTISGTFWHLWLSHEIGASIWTTQSSELLLDLARLISSLLFPLMQFSGINELPELLPQAKISSSESRSNDVVAAKNRRKILFLDIFHLFFVWSYVTYVRSCPT